MSLVLMFLVLKAARDVPLHLLSEEYEKVCVGPLEGSVWG